MGESEIDRKAEKTREKGREMERKFMYVKESE